VSLYRLSNIEGIMTDLNGQVKSLPPSFTWGTATASYQVEGAVDEDGRGESIWDRFASVPGNVLDGSDGRVACDQYHRFPEDVALMRELGVDAYRFSIAWPRILPQGTGTPNVAGLDFYDRLVDELLENDIEPYATLYHWDLPQALEERGGWPARDTVDAFCAYAEAVAARLGDRVGSWITQNEPWVVSWLGYGLGVHAPGRRSERDALAAAHHVLLAHGHAVEILRRESPGARVGITIDVVDVQPENEADVGAARMEDGYRNRWFLDPVLRGSYPADVAERFAALMPPIAAGDLEAIAAPIDFLGVNYYTRNVVRADPATGMPVVVALDGVDRTAMGWEVYPEGLYRVLMRLHSEYGAPPLYVTENGAACADVRGPDGRVDDPARVAYLRGHVDAIARAAADGAPVAGYFVWSLLDNFEWAYGYTERFGLVYVDYETLERVPKQSFAWYRDHIAAQRAAAVASALPG
jgi:beta-glucosidase